MLHQYVHFVESFERLSPYEVDHFCKVVHRHYKELFDLQNKNNEVSERDFKEIIIHAMKAAQIELAEQQLQNAEFNLQQVKSRLYVD